MTAVFVFAIGQCTPGSETTSADNAPVSIESQQVFDELTEEFLRGGQYSACLRGAGIQLHCGSCPGATLDVSVQIGSGRTIASEVLGRRICEGQTNPRFEECVLDYVNGIFKPELVDGDYRGIFGTGLGC